MSFSLATLFAFAAAVLMALAIFAPRRGATNETPRLQPYPVAGLRATQPPAGAPAWPRLIDPRAAACDGAARLEIAGALETLGTPWALAVLERALEEETDPAVLGGIAAASAQLGRVSASVAGGRTL